MLSFFQIVFVCLVVSCLPEGPRIHVVTSDGALWMAGTTHKGLGANHLYKTMQPDRDHLSFYRVGGAAADVKASPVHTGAAEDLKDESMRAQCAWRMGMSDAALFGRDGQTNYLTDTKIVHSQPGLLINHIIRMFQSVIYSKI